MDQLIRLNLYYYETCSLNKFACHADRLLIRTRKTERATILSPSNSAKDKISNQRLINELVETRLDSLHCNFTRLMYDGPCLDNRNTPTESNFRRRNSFLPRKPLFASNDNFVFENSPYHKKYSNRAYKCGGAPLPHAPLLRNSLYFSNVLCSENKNHILVFHWLVCVFCYG